MPGSKRTIRKVQTSKVADFDDQLWPINCAILILAGFATGIVIATSDFDNPRILLNGWARLICVAVMAGLLFWGVFWLQGKMLRRLQFCLVVSLLIHVGLMVYFSYEKWGFDLEWETASRDQVIEQYQQIILPDYDWQQIERPHAQRSFEEPIATEAPRPTDPEAVQREADEPDLPAETRPPDEPEVPQRQQPNPAITRRAQLSAPRRADAAAGAQISRQPWKDRPSPNQPIPEPDITAQSSQIAAVPDATTAPRPRAEIRVRADRLRMPQEPLSERARQVEVEMPRRAVRNDPLADSRTVATATRRAAPPAQSPPSRPATPESISVARTSPRVAPRPADTATVRQQAEGPTIARPRGNSTPASPSVAIAISPMAQRPPPDQTPSPASPNRVTQVHRSSEPNLPADLAGPQPEAIASRAAASDPTDRPIARPTTRAVSRAADSLSGAVPPAAGEAASARPLPPMSNRAELPSAVAARRATASQEQPAGSQTVPARPSSLARQSAVGTLDRVANLPSTTIAVEAQPAATPAAAGGTPASRLQVVSDAAVLRSAGRPRVGDNTAAAGTADFALGSGEVVARTGQPRSAGIGRSVPTATGSARRIARAAGPAAPTTASSIAEAAPAVPGTVASGPGGPRVPSLNVQASATRRGGTVRPFAVVPAVGAGPAGSSGTSGPVGVSQSSRVSRQESIASAVAGGGTPKPGRTVGGDVAPNVVAEESRPAQSAVGTPAAPTGGKATQAATWQAQVSGPRRQISGLPGDLQGQPMAGALASLSDQGAPLPSAAGSGVRSAAARRASGSQQDPGGRDIGSSRSATIRRAPAGTDLPAAAAAIDDAPKAGDGGLDVVQGGLPSSLQTGPNATVRQAAADLPVGQSTTAAGTSDSALGAARAVAMAGRTRAVAIDLPASGGGPSARRIGRTAMAVPPAAGGDVPTIDTSGTLPTEPVAETPTGDPAAARAGNLGQSTARDLQAAVARGSSQVPAVGQTEGPRAGVSPGDSSATAKPGPPGPDGARTAAGRRRISQIAGPGPSLAGEVGRVPRRTAGAPVPPAAGDAVLLDEVAETIEQQPIAAAEGPASSGGVDLSGAMIGEASRPEGGLPVRIAATEGPGGLGYLPSPEVGIPSRRARPESEIIHTIFRRFVIERSGGQVAIDGRVRQEPTEAFRQRDPGQRADVAQAWGGSEGTEAAVERGLDYFARHQFPDGHWSLHELPPGIQHQDPALGQMQSDSAATGLALLSYLGAGYTHLDDKYRGVAGRGIDWLLRHQKPDGELFTGGAKYTRFYSHGIAAIALCEAYGMTRDPNLREPAHKAIQFILDTQHPIRGGWRYDLSPETGRATETDTSVSGWMLMALKSAQMAGLEVPQEAFRKVDSWLDTARADGADGQYVYNPHAMDTPEQRTGRRPNLAMTSEAMLMRMYLGQDRDNAGLIAGAEHLKKNLPAVGTRNRPRRDCYYWYYATQAMFQMQDDYWTEWNDRLSPLATNSQVTSGELAGSWHPLRPVEDRWGQAGGRHYVTALHLLMLEVYYRHLPLFRELSR